MTRPPLEVADLVRTAGTSFIERNRQWLRWTHIKVLLAIVRCRTAALGGHIDACMRCGHRAAISYNSCRNRHCPKCQTGARERWIQARRRELLSTPYVHVVFTLPPQLASLALQNKKVIYGLLLRASAETLLEVARNPRHLGAEIGFFSVLHTWNQKLQLHPHVHCVIPAGGLSLDRTRWIRSRPRFFLPIQVLRRVFRGKFVAGLKSAFQRKQLHLSGNLAFLAQPKIFTSWLRPLFRKDWIVYCKPPFGGPEYVLHYLGRYIHRVAISNHRLVSFENGQVTFRWRDSARNNEQKLMALSLDEFLRRFLLHLLPKGFVRIRHFGFLASRRRAQLLPLCLAALDSLPAQTETSTTQDMSPHRICPQCGGTMAIIERLTAVQIQLRSPPKLSLATA
ncbi:MAG TPA: IS91 family transposase [Candidatus Eisenbacteria bacterium]|nr:IS91 family transposase [Candidatus Eisenbacteria bacterium]